VGLGSRDRPLLVNPDIAVGIDPSQVTLNGHGRAAFSVTHNTPIIEDVVVCFPLQNGFQYYRLGA